jgi:signal transduction histidine kinase
MTLKAKLTLGSVLLATLIVGLISAVDLGNDMQRLFDATYDRAALLRTVATRLVVQSLERQRTVPLAEALRDPSLTSGLIDIGAASRAVFEIAVVSPRNEILADSDPSRIGVISPPFPDFQPVLQERWLAKLRILRETGKYYQLEGPLGVPQAAPLLYVRVIIEPALIRKEIVPTMLQSAKVALGSIAGAVLITFLFSVLAFRPLGELGQLLDQVARGEFEPARDVPAKVGPRDEVAVIASKVSLLGERLRGAQSEVSDLRGNFDRLLHDLEDAVFIFNRERRLVFASGTVEKFLGQARHDLTGQAIGEIFPPSSTLGLLIAQAAQTGRSLRHRRVPVAPSAPGAEPAVVLVSVDLIESLPGSSTAGAGLIVRLSDPEATRKLSRELQTADRLAAISRITSGVAHEVKNPLNAILLHVEVAKAKLLKGENDVAPQMEIISREILRLDRVVKTFLDFTRPVELNFSSVPLGDFIVEMADLARPQADAAKIALEVREEAEGAEVRIDHDLMKQALWNVVLNAIEAMPQGGELRLHARIAKETAEIAIEDTGPGIAPELREKIFRLYFTTKQGGTGIGLAMAFRVVQLHGGTIDFTSEPGKGTAFLVRLPMAV